MILISSRIPHQKAFTLIELILVIVIIGVLAAVALPKIAANKDNAIGTQCTHEIGQLINEVSNAYISGGYRRFVDLQISSISNVKTNIVNGQGIKESPNTKVHMVGVTFQCDGEGLIFIVGHYNTTTGSYQLSITDLNPTRPATLKAAKQLRNLYSIGAGETKIYAL